MQSTHFAYLRFLDVSCDLCSYDWIALGNSYYHSFNETKTWEESWTACAELGSHLVKIDTEGELIGWRSHSWKVHWLTKFQWPDCSGWNLLSGWPWFSIILFIILVLIFLACSTFGFLAVRVEVTASASGVELTLLPFLEMGTLFVRNNDTMYTKVWYSSN